jgi:hypothetical protein
MVQKWEYLLVPLGEAAGVKKGAQGTVPDRLNEWG